jgi:hypothetical protein
VVSFGHAALDAASSSCVGSLRHAALDAVLRIKSAMTSVFLALVFKLSTHNENY